MDQSKFIWLGRIEGVSLLLLFFVAMPLKHLMDMPLAVRIVGSAHGALFVIYVLAAIVMASVLSWKKTTLLLCLILSSVPFGTFWFEKRYLRA